MKALEKKRVLVMGNNDPVRELLSAALMAYGLRTCVTGNSYEAVEQFEKAKQSGFPFHVVILDLEIPDGFMRKKVIRKLHEIDPDVRAIVLSSTRQTADFEDCWKYGLRCELSKPFTLAELRAALSRAMNGDERMEK
jgi:CheY-like chemotaxis protein